MDPAQRKRKAVRGEGRKTGKSGQVKNVRDHFLLTNRRLG